MATTHRAHEHEADLLTALRHHELMAVVVMRDVEGLSNADIAEILGLNVALVKTRLHRARLFGRKHLDRDMATMAPRAWA